MFGGDNEARRALWIEEALADIPAGLKILDAGAGDQHNKELCKHLEYVSQDFAKYDGKGDGAGLQTQSYDYGDLNIISDITEIPVESESFDAVLCTEVLEHVKDPIAVIKELVRVLKKGGTLILTAPFCSLTHFAPYHFSTGFNIYWYREVLADSRVHIFSEIANGDYFEYLAQELHRVIPIASSYCDKPYYTPEEADAFMKMLKMLERFSETGKKSSEVLNFGYMIEGVKE